MPSTHSGLTFELKANKETRIIEGYAAIFGNVDRVGDILLPSAFDATLIARKGRIAHLLHHDPRRPIGLPELKADLKGLFFKTQVDKTRDGDEALEQADSGSLTGNSFGYVPIKPYRKDIEGKSVRHLHKVDLIEITSTTNTINEEATITRVVKSMQGFAEMPLAVLEAMKGGIDTAYILAMVELQEEQKGVSFSGTLRRLLEAHISANSIGYEHGRALRAAFVQDTARKIGVTPGYIAELLGGGIDTPPEAIIVALADALGVPAERLRGAAAVDSSDPAPAAQEKGADEAQAAKAFREYRAEHFKSGWLRD